VPQKKLHKIWPFIAIAQTHFCARNAQEELLRKAHYSFFAGAMDQKGQAKIMLFYRLQDWYQEVLACVRL
jgi:hypothetical protein